LKKTKLLFAKEIKPPMQKRTYKLLKRIFLICLALIAFILFFIPMPALSSDVRFAKDLTISANEIVNDDVYLAGERVRIDGTINGDAIVAGTEIIINGVVTGDVMAAGRSITINGKVNDDIRMAGQSIALESKAQIGDDAMLAGWGLEQRVGSNIGGDLYFGGFQALLAGNVSQNFVGGMNSLELRGTIGKDVKATVVGDPNIFQWPFLPQPLKDLPQLPLGLTIGDTAKIGGDLSYRSTKAGQIGKDARIAGQVQYTNIEVDRAYAESKNPVNPVLAIVWQIQRLLALLLIGWALLHWMPRWTKGLAETIQTQPWQCLGWGAVGAIAVAPAAITIFLVIVFLGGLFALTLPMFIPPLIGGGFLTYITLSLVLTLIVAYLAPILVSLLGGQRLMQLVRPTETRQIAILGIGLLIFAIVTAIPVLGWVLSLIAALFGLGAIWVSLRGRGYHPAPDRSLVST
jgi:cytoskeletal protein CcmA (bactofilin family)